MKEHIGRRSQGRAGRSTVDWLLILGILTFLVWPFISLWQIQAFPAWDSETYQRAANAVKGLMAEARSQPFRDNYQEKGFRTLESSGDHEIEGRVEYLPHPDLPGLTLIRAQVRWGYPLFKKSLFLESAITQTRP